MSWPLASDFSAVLQNPAFAFADSELKTVEIEKDANRQPKPRSGNFANVYKGILPNGKPPVAVRVFTSESPERRERYQAIADHLAHCRLDCLVNFTYRDDGIRSMNGKRYPLVTMEWVRGEQLFEWVQRKCDDRDKKSLIGATDSWVATMKELRAAKIAHGDLQHANVMVDERGKLKLVDYDCMCVPSLVGRKNLEIGVDPYQHPTRDQDTKLSLSIDNFSSIFIFIALKAVAESPELWLNYVERPGYDKLLFRREDLDSPKDSRLMQELQRSKDKEVQRLAKELVDLTHLSIDQVPPLDELLFSFSSVESLLSQRDFDGANR
jgi:serine/threonine protein kinase